MFDEPMLQGQMFVANLRATGTWDGDGPARRPLSQSGAEALAGMLVQQLDDRGGKSALRLFGTSHDSDPGLTRLLDQSLGVALAGALAFGMTGRWTDDLAERLLLTAVDPRDEAVRWRNDLFRERPFGQEPRVLPEWTIPIRRFLETECFAGVLKAVLAAGRQAGQRLTVDAVGITAVAPKDVCPGATLRITGSGFGSTQPTDVRLLIPTRGGGCREFVVDPAVPPNAWTDTVITIIAPQDIGPGCVGFVRGTLQYIEPSNVSGELTTCVGAVGQLWGAAFDKVRFPVHSCPSCLPLGENRITSAGAPTINFFRCTPAVVEPGEQPVLSWHVTNAVSVDINVTSGSSPTLALPNPGPIGSITWPAVTGTSVTSTHFTLTARNACGASLATAGFTLTRRPRLTVDRIEVVQGEQLTDNSVRLVANRRTAVRVFVGSGITDGFDLGDGPGAVGGLDVSLFAQNPATGAMRSCGPPWNPGFLAKPTANRDVLGDSLNFEVPLAACTGTVRFLATVTAPAPVTPNNLNPPPVSFATGSTQVTFTNRPQQEVLPFLITDPGSTAPVPNMAAFTATMDGPVRMHPFPANGFVVHPALPLTLSSVDSLWATLGWERLIARLTTMFFIFPSQPVGGVRVAIAPSDAPLWGGMALPRIGLTTPSMIVVSGATETATHELGHAFGLQHVNLQMSAVATCGSPAGPYDASLPFTLADPAVDVASQRLFPSGTPESMTYCSPQWPSRQHWDQIFDRIPI